MAAFGRSSVKRAETAQSIADAKAASRFSGDYFVYPQDLSADYCFSIKMQSYNPSKLAKTTFGEWIITNPFGTYKEWKEHLQKTNKTDGN